VRGCLALPGGAGIRRTELAGVNREDLDLETGRVLPERSTHGQPG